jgi:hypothetical protein
MVDKWFGNALGIIKRHRCLRPDGLFLQRAVDAFDLAIALRIMRRGEDVKGLEVADEGFEVLGHELGTVVCDDPGAKAGICFVSPRGLLFIFALVFVAGNMFKIYLNQHVLMEIRIFITRARLGGVPMRFDLEKVLSWFRCFFIRGLFPRMLRLMCHLMVSFKFYFEMPAGF